ncbi:hypothetical protein LPJ71_000750, partial [Coemansia sp. S17]
MAGIVSGTAHTLLTEYMGDTTALPMVYELVVIINDYNSEYEGSKESAIANILQFAKLLKSLTPNATMTNVICASILSCLDERDPAIVGVLDEELFGILANALYSNAKHALLNLGDINPKLKSTIDSLPQLSRLELNYLTLPVIHASLATKSASTLQYLDIRVDDVSRLFKDTNGDDVVYPNLQHLR